MKSTGFCTLVTKHAEPRQISVFQNIEDLPDSWDSLIPDGHLLRKHNLLKLSATTIDDISNYFVISETKGRLHAVAVFQLLQIRQKHINPDTKNFFGRLFRNLLVPVAKPKLLVAGLLFHHEISTFFCPEESGYEAYVSYSSMMDVLMANTCAHALLIKDMNDNLGPFFQSLRPDLQRMPADTMMYMQPDPTWHHIDDYMHALKHKYAQRFRKIRSSMDKLECRELSYDEIVLNSNRLFELYSQVANNQNARLGFLPNEYIGLMKHLFPDKFRVWAFFEEDQIVAFFSAWVTPKEFDMYYIGLDYSQNDRLSLYFNILYACVELCIAEKSPVLNFGRTALEAKARLGCKAKYLSTFLLIRNPIIRYWFRQINLREPDEVWENRHPFK